LRLGVVIPCYRQERFLPRTLQALERGLGDRAWHGALVVSGPRESAVGPGPRAAPGRARGVSGAGSLLPPLSERWRVLGAQLEQRLTPGGARMLGLAALDADWVLFVDADVEIDSRWAALALERAARDPRLAGLGGRLEEWIEQGTEARLGNPDMYRVGAGERAVPYLATLALYRREALLEVGGYDARLDSEEDYELGMRLRAAGFAMLSLPGPAGRHWSGPRPSLAELRRRWRTGLCFGMGQALRIYWGRPGFVHLLGRQRLYLVTLGLWALGAATLAIGLMGGEWPPFLVWIQLLLLVWLLMSVRKRSPRLGLHSLLSWTANGLGLMIGFFQPRLPAPAPVAVAEAR
jgi:glycosyl transferase family 2